MVKSSLSASSLSTRFDVARGSIGTKAARSAAATARKGELAIATPATAAIEERDDHFVVRNGVRCAGAHLIIDLYGAERLDDIDHIEAALRRAVNAASATLLHIHLHHFEPNGGVSGVAVLAESHISIHTWPENGYAALDVFMCGKAKVPGRLHSGVAGCLRAEEHRGQRAAARAGRLSGGGRDDGCVIVRDCSDAAVRTEFNPTSLLVRRRSCRSIAGRSVRKRSPPRQKG